jgi:hypothetical protein
MGWDIKRAIDGFGFADARCATFRNYTLVSCKETPASATNDIVLVFDNDRGKWVGRWNVPAACFAEYGGALYFGSSASRETYRLFHTATAQAKGSVSIGYRTRCATQWVSLGDGVHQEQFDTLAVRGYVNPTTRIIFRLYFDRSTEPYMQWSYDPVTATSTVLGATSEEVLGTVQIGTAPLGVELSSENDETGAFGELPFIAFFKVPAIPHTFVKMEWETDGAGTFAEINDVKANVTVLPAIAEAFVVDTES